MANLIKPPCDEAIIRSAPDTAPSTRALGRWVLLVTILGSSMAFIDGTAVNVALPALQRSLDATVTDVQWMVEAYALLLASLILVGGTLGDRFGRRRSFAIGVGLFTLAAVSCGLAQNSSQLILARAMQGIGGALLLPGSLAIISTTFSSSQRGTAIGTWSSFTAITATLRPVLGGWLVEHVPWRGVFFINVPLAAIVLGALFWRVPESRDEEERAEKLDWPGALLVTLALFAIVYGLISSNMLGRGHPVVIAALVVGVVTLMVFLLWEDRNQAPLMPLALFRSSTFSGANGFTFLLYAAVGGFTFFFPFDLIQAQGYSPTAAGAALLPLILIVFLLSRWSGGLMDRYGARLPLVIGPLIVTAGFALAAIPAVGGLYWTTFFPAVIVLGVGMAISSAPLTTTVMGAVESQQAGLASGINNAVSRSAALVSVAVLSIVALSAFASGLDERLAQLRIAPPLRALLEAQRTKLGGIQIPAEVGGQVYRTLQRALADSFVSGFRMVMLIAWLAIGVPRVAGSGSRVSVGVGGQERTDVLRKGNVAP